MEDNRNTKKEKKYITNKLNYIYSIMIKDHVDENEFIINNESYF